jgi:periplasmic protein TonB
MDLIIPVVILVLLTVVTSLLFKFFFFKKNLIINSVNSMTNIERLLTKKYKEVDTHSHKKYTSIAGVFVIMIFSIVLIEFGREIVEEQIIEKVSINDVFDETIDIPITEQKPPPPPPKKKSIVLVVSEEELIEALEIPLDTIPEKEEIVFEEEEDEEEEEEEIAPQIYEFVEQESVPHNGNLFTYSDFIFSKINKNAIKPDMQAGLKGFLEIEMVVLENGDLTQFNVTNSVGPNIDREIKRILNSAPKWTPAKMNGKIVRQKVLFQMMIDY